MIWAVVIIGLTAFVWLATRILKKELKEIKRKIANR